MNEALRLADYMDDALNDPNDVADAVSAELRLLYTQRDALLEALQDLCDTLGECGMTEKARAAIKAAEGEKS